MTARPCPNHHIHLLTFPLFFFCCQFLSFLSRFWAFGPRKFQHRWYCMHFLYLPSDYSDQLIELGFGPTWLWIRLQHYQAGPALCYPRSSPFGNTLHDPRILEICFRLTTNPCASTAKTNLPQNSRDRQGQTSLQPSTALQCQGDRPFIGPPDVNEISLTWANSHWLLCPLSIKTFYASPRAPMCNESHGTKCNRAR